MIVISAAEQVQQLVALGFGPEGGKELKHIERIHMWMSADNLFNVVVF
jgi:hypothetical protein